MYTHKIYALMMTLLIMVSCDSSNQTKDFSEEEIAQEVKKLNAFFQKSFDESLDSQPEFLTYLGNKKDQDKWDDLSPEKEAQDLQITKNELQWIQDSINILALTDDAKTSYDLFIYNAERSIRNYQYRLHNYPVNQMFGAHSGKPAFLINMHQINNEEDAQAYISRLNGIKPLFVQLIANLQTREDNGILTPKFVFPKVIQDCKNLLEGKPFTKGKSSTLLTDFTSKLEKIPLEAEVRENLITEATAALTDSFEPAYRSLIAFLEGQEKRANNDDGAWKFPNGEAFFNNALKNTTTTSLTSQEIHDLGLAEVSRIHSEMKKIMAQVKFEGDLQAFFKFLKDDDQFYLPNTEEGKKVYMDSATAIINTMKGRLDELFITKPKADMIVKRVEAFREMSAGKAFYNSPALDGSRPGTYYANLANTKNMPVFEMEALAYHEGIPGHHMQLSIAQELEGLPKFRAFARYTAYTEGWGLYCEFIPKEMGMYADPYSDYGRLAMELWRACRLVVDTGIHSKKWTRDEGIAYYKNNTSGSEAECIRMVERHIVMPSQATAYKIGMLKILELRANAKEKLGDKFDIREFHEVVLTKGPVPLDLLEKMVAEWISSKA